MVTQFTPHRRLLVLAIPMIIANVTTPILGLVDTAVLGHLPNVEALAGASIGALVITQLYWICGFLRMSLTGLSAQAYGQKDLRQSPEYTMPVFQGLALAACLALALLLTHVWLIPIVQSIAATDTLTSRYLDDYFTVRIWGAPAALGNLVLIGWLVGQQKTKHVLLIQVFGNLVNIVLSVLLVMGFGYDVKGVASATIISEYLMFFASLWLCFQSLVPQRVKLAWFRWQYIRQLCSLNVAIFVRNLALQLCLAFITFQGARLGAQTAAVNAILMQFFVLISLGLDGIAYAVEALVGEAKGQRKASLITAHTQRGLLWSGALALLNSSFFIIAGDWIIGLLTNNELLRNAAADYTLIIVLLPVVAFWCFLFDGVFVGLSEGKAMRDTMVLSAVLGFFPVWWLLASFQNWALWWAFLSFLGARGITLGWTFWRHRQTGRWLD